MPILVLYAGCAEGMFEKVEWNKLLNPADFGEPLSPCGVPVVNSSGVLVYDADRIKDGPRAPRPGPISGTSPNGRASAASGTGRRRRSRSR